MFFGLFWMRRGMIEWLIQRCIMKLNGMCVRIVSCFISRSLFSNYHKKFELHSYFLIIPFYSTTNKLHLFTVFLMFQCSFLLLFNAILRSPMRPLRCTRPAACRTARHSRPPHPFDHAPVRHNAAVHCRIRLGGSESDWWMQPVWDCGTRWRSPCSTPVSAMDRRTPSTTAYPGWEIQTMRSFLVPKENSHKKLI